MELWTFATDCRDLNAQIDVCHLPLPSQTAPQVTTPTAVLDITEAG